MELNNTQLNIVAGQPGVGKSHRLINDALTELLDNKQTVVIITPTHSARSNLQAVIDEKINAINTDEIGKRKLDIEITHRDYLELKALNYLKRNIKVMYGYAKETRVFIDEISMISVPTLFNLLYQTQYMKDVKITAYGDIKQLPAINSNSVIEELLRPNIKGNLWDWVRQAYENVEFDKLEAPKHWHLKNAVNFEVMLTNYRLQEQGFNNGFNDEYIEKVMNNVFFNGDDSNNKESATSDYYKNIIIEVVKSHVLIISPTHDRGKEVNDFIWNEYGSEAIYQFPFLKEIRGTKVYLNPDYIDFKDLKREFPSINNLSEHDLKHIENFEPTAYVVVNVAQGITVENVLYYMGNTPISNGNKSHYSFNNFYTAITRSKKLAMLAGKPELFRKMLDIHPITAQDRLRHIRADFAVKELFEQLLINSVELNKDQVFDLYMTIFNNNEEFPYKGDMKDLSYYSITDEPYTLPELLLKFKNYDVMQALRNNTPNYRLSLYEPYIKETNVKNGENRAGKGKVQVWIKSLSADDLSQVEKDIEKLSMRKFKEKYKVDKRQTTKAINDLEL